MKDLDLGKSYLYNAVKCHPITYHEGKEGRWREVEAYFNASRTPLLEVSGQLHASVASPPGKGSGTHFTGG
jgi:hypothetical protein